MLFRSKHYDTWKEQNLLGVVAQKKILTLQLEQLTLKDRQGAVEVPTYETQNVTPSLPQTSAIIIWGAGVPISSAKKDVAYEVLNILTTPAVQESILLKTSFNSALSQVTDLSIPLNRRASFIRNLQLKDTLFIDRKDAEANLRLKNEYGLVL